MSRGSPKSEVRSPKSNKPTRETLARAMRDFMDATAAERHQFRPGSKADTLAAFNRFMAEHDNYLCYGKEGTMEQRQQAGLAALQCCTTFCQAQKIADFGLRTPDAAKEAEHD